LIKKLAFARMSIFATNLQFFYVVARDKPTIWNGSYY